MIHIIIFLTKALDAWIIFIPSVETYTERHSYSQCLTYRIILWPAHFFLWENKFLLFKFVMGLRGPLLEIQDSVIMDVTLHIANVILIGIIISITYWCLEIQPITLTEWRAFLGLTLHSSYIVTTHTTIYQELFINSIAIIYYDKTLVTISSNDTITVTWLSDNDTFSKYSVNQPNKLTKHTHKDH